MKKDMLDKCFFFPARLYTSAGLLVFVFLFGQVTFSQSPAPIVGGLLNGKAVSLPKPVYPPGTSAQGVVRVSVVIDEKGVVISATTDANTDAQLGAAAIEAARQAKFTPTLLKGQPARVTGYIVYNFVNNKPPSSSAPPISTIKSPPVTTPVADPDCPNVIFISGDEFIAGSPAQFTVIVKGGDPNLSATYNWTVSKGAITVGQGTPDIIVDTAAFAEGVSVTAAVELGGLLPKCPRTFDHAVTFRKTAAEILYRLEQSMSQTRITAQLKGFADSLEKNAATRAYIFAYGGYGRTTAEARAAADGMRDYLIKERGIDPKRIIRIDGGDRDVSVNELWIVPPGVKVPVAVPEKP